MTEIKQPVYHVEVALIRHPEGVTHDEATQHGTVAFLKEDEKTTYFANSMFLAAIVDRPHGMDIAFDSKAMGENRPLSSEELVVIWSALGDYIKNFRCLDKKLRRVIRDSVRRASKMNGGEFKT